MLKQLYPVLLVFLIGVFGTADQSRAADLDSPSFALPIDCELGKSCFVQNYVDVDPGPGRLDYACGQATYDGHKGTDFRVLSTKAAAGVHVLAAADGKVLRGRDGMPDKLVRDYKSKSLMRSAIAGRDCGNGIVVDHGGGWTTQYCHLKSGSLLVKPGQSVKQGTPLGLVGFSGRADFAHVHLTVRHKDVVLDPFTGRKQNKSCGIEQAEKQALGLWEKSLLAEMRYGKERIIGAGFAGVPPDLTGVERDHTVSGPAPHSKALVFYVRMINLRVGDRLRLRLAGPAGFKTLAQTTKPEKRSRAHKLVYGGRKLRAERWPAGKYTGAVAVIQKAGKGSADRVVERRKVEFTMP